MLVPGAAGTANRLVDHWALAPQIKTQLDIRCGLGEKLAG
jgi:hypothetical protein